MGLARDLVLTARLGASQTIAADAYYTALAFPNLFRRIFAEGAFAAAFVPGYSRKLASEGAEPADRYAADALATVAAATVALTIAAQLAMPWLMYLINPGYADEPAKFKLAVILTQITMPYLPCMAIAALFSGVLNARGRFIVSGFYPTILNLVMLAAVLPQEDPERAAYAASIAVLVAGVGQAGLCWWGARRTGARISPSRLKLTPDMRQLVRLAIPAAIANSATQINLFISGIMASQVPGARVWMNVADRFYQLPMSLVGVAIGVALLPRLSSALESHDEADARAAMDQGLIFGLAFSLPAAAALVAMPVYLVDAFFTRGAFLAQDARATGELLFHYGWGVPAFVLLRILQPAFFARQDTRTPMRFSLISVGINIVAGVGLFFLIGIPGIAAATSLAAWISVLQMANALWRDGVYRPQTEVISRAARVLVASLAMGAVMWGASLARASLEAPLADVPGGGILVAILVCLSGALLYLLLLFGLRAITPAQARAVLRRRRNRPLEAPGD